MSLIKRLEFFIEISQYLSQGYNTLKQAYDFFKHKHLKERLEDYEGFKETLQFLEAQTEPNRKVKLIYYIFRFALNTELNPEILVDALDFLKKTIGVTSPDEPAYPELLLQSKHLLSTIISQL